MNDTKREKLQIVKIQLKSKNSICKVCLLDTLVFIIPSLTVEEQKTVAKPVKSRLVAVFYFAAICAIVLYFFAYGKFISVVCLMMLRIVDFLINS